MRPTPSRRQFSAALLAASVLAPLTAAPAAALRSSGRPGRRACPPDGLGPELTARLDRTIEEARREAGIPGIVTGLWMPGRGNYVRATGVADTASGTPMTTDVFVRIGSETKTFTVTALLKLVDDRKIRLDDPISKYVAGVPNGRRITLRHLAEMRSGLFPYTADQDFIEALFSDPSRSFTPAELLRHGFRHPNTAAPGTTFQYCNTNLVLLGLVVERVGGRPFADFLRERVLRPARLHRTFFPGGRRVPRAAPARLHGRHPHR
jgi:D-alanyl-D-alanine carboxypeptidase